MNEDELQKLPTTPLEDALSPRNDFTIAPKEPSSVSTPIEQNHRPHTNETPQKAIRTYESDVADVLAHKNISTTTIALAEKQRETGEVRIGNNKEGSSQETKGSDSHALKKSMLALASLILIGLGLGGGYYLYTISPLYVSSAGTPQAAPTPPASIVPADDQVTLSIDNMSPIEIIKMIRAEIAKPQTPDTVKEIILTETKNGQRFRVDSAHMIGVMSITAPDILTRSLSNDWMLGVYADSQGAKSVFVIASIGYFQDAFAGMLQWESYMADDLKQYLYENAPADISVVSRISTPPSPMISATSSSSTQETASTTVYAANSAYSTVINGLFTDKIIQNKDVREFITNNGVLFLYSFIDNNKLMISGSESALSEVLKRLEQNAFVR